MVRQKSFSIKSEKQIDFSLGLKLGSKCSSGDLLLLGLLLDDLIGHLKLGIK